MRWRESLATGVKELDLQYAQLFGEIEHTSRQIMRDRKGFSISKHIAELAEKFNEHFEYEEAMMKELGYPYVFQHQYSHQKLIEHFTEVMDAFMSDVDSYPSDYIQRSVSNWFVKHIISYDKSFADFYNSRQNWDGDVDEVPVPMVLE